VLWQVYLQQRNARLLCRPLLQRAHEGVRERSDTDAAAPTATNTTANLSAHANGHAKGYASGHANGHANGYADTRRGMPVVQHDDARLLRRHRHPLLDDSGRLLRHDL
jgi:hypothetical protein